MERRSRRRAAAVIVTVVVMIAGCKRAPASAAQHPSAGGSRFVAVPYDRALTDEVRVLAGLAPEDAKALARVTREAAWTEYREALDADWTDTDRERLARMRAWREAELAADARACGTLLYPFSGPDILNAYVLFPDCDTYVLFGLEHVGALPRLDLLPPDRLDQLFADVRHATADLISRNYFITKRMMSDLETSDLHGNLPVVALLLARLDARFLAVRSVEIDPDGRIADPDRDGAHHAGAAETPSGSKPVPAFEIVFVTPQGRKQTVIYFRALADNAPLAQHPGVVRFLDRYAPWTTLLKSASYLLHTATFTTMRRVIVDGSRLIVQDDSGVPYRFLSPPGWRVSLYGQYRQPVKDFNYGYQADLAARYAEPNAAKPLDFPFGYHWQTGTSTVMVARRVAPSPASH